MLSSTYVLKTTLTIITSLNLHMSRAIDCKNNTSHIAFVQSVQKDLNILHSNLCKKQEWINKLKVSRKSLKELYKNLTSLNFSVNNKNELKQCSESFIYIILQILHPDYVTEKETESIDIINIKKMKEIYDEVHEIYNQLHEETNAIDAFTSICSLSQKIEYVIKTLKPALQYSSKYPSIIKKLNKLLKFTQKVKGDTPLPVLTKLHSLISKFQHYFCCVTEKLHKIEDNTEQANDTPSISKVCEESVLDDGSVSNASPHSTVDSLIKKMHCTNTVKQKSRTKNSSTVSDSPSTNLLHTECNKVSCTMQSFS